jgi:anti-sigma B factor antagonist
MDISLTCYENIPVVRVTGDIDMATAPEFETALETHSEGFSKPLLIDMSECLFLDSGALNVLLQAVRRVEPPRWLGVVGANRNLRRVFEIVALPTDPRFRILDDFAAACS